MPKTGSGSQDRWQVTSQGGDADAYVVEAPRFGFDYMAGIPLRIPVDAFRYVEDTQYEQRIEFSPSFVVNVGGEHIPAAISDFTEIALVPGGETKITLTSASGQKTTGGLILDPHDKAAATVYGSYTRSWALVADVEDTHGAIMILSPQCAIKKVGDGTVHPGVSKKPADDSSAK